MRKCALFILTMSALTLIAYSGFGLYRLLRIASCPSQEINPFPHPDSVTDGLMGTLINLVEGPNPPPNSDTAYLVISLQAFWGLGIILGIVLLIAALSGYSGTDRSPDPGGSNDS